MLDSILKDIAAPAVEMHGAPFFALNAKLDPEEMRREMNVFHTMGMGGCFLHTRVGLATPYLGKDYMDSLRAVVATTTYSSLSLTGYLICQKNPG